MRTRADQEAHWQQRDVPVRDNAPRRHASPIPEEVYKPWTLPRQQAYVFVNINVVDTTEGKILPGRIVRIQGGQITSITPQSDAASEQATQPAYHHPGSKDDEAIHINSAGKYLSPGLIDAHVHLASVPGTADLQSAMATPAAVSAFRQPFQCKQMLERGYTSARDCGGASPALKEAISEGVFPGPRLFIAGHALSQTGGHGDRRGAHEDAATDGGELGGGLSTVVDGVPEVLRAARTQVRRGADFLKLMAGGGVASPTDALGGVQFTGDEMRAAADVADAAGTFATAHAYTARAVRRAVGSGVRGIEHGNFIDEETARLMADNGVYLTPTLVTYQAMADPRYAAFLPGHNQDKNRQVLEQGLKSVRIAHEAGVRMCLGSDLLSFLGVEQLKEFGLRAQVLGSEDVLRHATVNPARMLGQENQLGQVKEGFIADLLVLNANPLEDVTIFEKPEKHLLAVIKEGRVYSSRWSKLPVDVEPRKTLLE